MRLLHGQGGGGRSAPHPLARDGPGHPSFGVSLERAPDLCCLTPARLGSDRDVGPLGFSPLQFQPSASGKEGSEVWVGRWRCLDLQSHRSRP